MRILANGLQSMAERVRDSRSGTCAALINATQYIASIPEASWGVGAEARDRALAGLMLK